MSVAGALDWVPPLRVLVVDGGAPARAELAQLLRGDPRIAEVLVAGSTGEALRMLVERPVAAIFCEVTMPGLDGFELARVVGRFAERPQMVFVSSDDASAADAFALRATDYLVKPLRAGRLAEAIRRVASAADAEPAGSPGGIQPSEDRIIAVELGGVTRFVRRSQVRFVQAQGDYIRLHTAGESHLLRRPLTVLQAQWADAGFVRIHRSTLVALAHVDEVRVVAGQHSVRVGGAELPVSRRHARELHERLLYR